MFIAKYVSLNIYDEDVEKRFVIDHEELKFDKNYGWNLFGIYDQPNGLMFDHDYFCFHKDLFEIIKSNHQ